MAEDLRGTPGRPRLLRTLNDRLALELLLDAGPLTRQQLAVRTRLSRPSISTVLARLEADGLVRRVSASSGPRGPMAAVYGVPARSVLAAVVDVRRDHARCQVVDVTGRVLGCEQVPADARSAPWTTVREALAATCAAADVAPDAVAVAVLAVGAAYDARADALANVEHLPGWAGPWLARRTAQQLGLEVLVENDVNLALVGERAVRDAGPDPLPDDGAVLLWFGDGVGLAVDVAGTVHRGASGRAGEIGYVAAPAPEGDGRRDVRSSIGGPALAALAAGYGLVADGANGNAPQGTVPDGTAAIAAAAALARSESRGRAARAFLADAAARLAGTLAPAVAVLDPAVVVLGGPGGPAGGALFAGLVEDEVRTRTRWYGRVVPTRAGTDSVLVGGRALALGHARTRLLDRVDRDAEQVAT